MRYRPAAIALSDNIGDIRVLASRGFGGLPGHEVHEPKHAQQEQSQDEEEVEEGHQLLTPGPWLVGARAMGIGVQEGLGVGCFFVVGRWRLVWDAAIVIIVAVVVPWQLGGIGYLGQVAGGGR